MTFIYFGGGYTTPVGFESVTSYDYAYISDAGFGTLGALCAPGNVDCGVEFILGEMSTNAAFEGKTIIGAKFRFVIPSGIGPPTGYHDWGTHLADYQNITQIAMWPTMSLFTNGNGDYEVSYDMLGGNSLSYWDNGRFSIVAQRPREWDEYNQMWVAINVSAETLYVLDACVEVEYIDNSEVAVPEKKILRIRI